jgi:hypothetical protein
VGKDDKPDFSEPLLLVEPAYSLYKEHGIDLSGKNILKIN